MRALLKSLFFSWRTGGLPVSCLLILLPSLSLVACGATQSIADCANPPLHFILPDDYVGPFRLTLDEVAGIDAALQDKRYSFEIPPGGMLKLKSFTPLAGCHRLSAAYKSGASIPVADSTTSPETIALRGGIGSAGKDTSRPGPAIITYVVGTKKDLDTLPLPVHVNDMKQSNHTP